MTSLISYSHAQLILYIRLQWENLNSASASPFNATFPSLLFSQGERLEAAPGRPLSAGCDLGAKYVLAEPPGGSALSVLLS